MVGKFLSRRFDLWKARNLEIVPYVEVARDPTGTDLRDPKTGQFYFIITFWRNSANGNLWYLAGITALVADWRQFDFGGGGPAIDFVTGDNAIQVGEDGSGNINFNGSVVTWNNNAGRPVYFKGNAGTFTQVLEVGVARATAVPGAGVKTDTGLASFNNAQFTVDTNGWVSLINQPQFSWVEETGATRNLSINQGVVGNRATAQTFTLPTTASLGDKICIVQKGAGNITIAQNVDQTIHWLDIDTTTGVGGSMTTTLQWSSVCLLCVTANNDWMVTDNEGNWDLV